MSALAPLLEAFFTERLIGQRHASPHTVAAYRDAFCLLLRFAQRHTGRAPHQLTLEDLDAALIGAFLNHLEAERGVSVRTRNARLTAIRSLFNFAAYRHPEHAALIHGCSPSRRSGPTRPSSPTSPTRRWRRCLPRPIVRLGIGRRDHTLLCSLSRQGCGSANSPGSPARLSSSAPAPTSAATAKAARSGSPRCGERRGRCFAPGSTSVAGRASDPLFPGPKGGRLSRDAIRRLVERHVATAASVCPSLATKNISPHTLRHSCAMNLLRHGVDTATIALWLGHEDVRTTYGVYLHADLGLKEKALARTAPPRTRPGRYRPTDALLAFFEGL